MTLHFFLWRPMLCCKPVVTFGSYWVSARQKYCFSVEYGCTLFLQIAPDPTFPLNARLFFCVCVSVCVCVCV